MNKITLAILVATALAASASAQTQEKPWDPNALRAARDEQAKGTGPFAKAIQTCLERKAEAPCVYRMAEKNTTFGDIIGRVNWHRMDEIRKATGGLEGITPATLVLKGTVIAVSFGPKRG